MTETIPVTLRGQFAEVRTKEDFGYALRDFLDRFRSAPEFACLADEPELLQPRLGDGGVSDAYLAASASLLCHENGWPSPGWAMDAKRVLDQPFFAASSHGLRMILLQESPAEFRSRNIFTSANALHRA